MVRGLEQSPGSNPAMAQYIVPKVLTFQDKPTIYSIPKEGGKPRDYFSVLQRQKAAIPGPIYETGLTLG